MFELTLGARPLNDGRTRFRVWAPDRRRVDVALERLGPGRNALSFLPLERGPDGYFSGAYEAAPGDRYRFRLDGGEAFPDPASRWQPEGPHGASVICDPRAYAWRDEGWRGLEGIRGQVLYELHVGTFTPEGTYTALQRELPKLKALGVTAVQLMPLHTCAGRFNWGYDGVDLFAPPTAYGTPEELKALVDEAHALGIGLLLDVVFNHLGPDGNYLGQFTRRYFSERYPKEWGDPLDFESEGAGPVRDLFIQNACYWVSEFHFDGLRVDATQSLYDASARHFSAELAERVRAAVPGRNVLLVAESEPQDVQYVEEGGHGFDAVWVEDFHHSARVAATGRAEAYMADYRGTAQELLSCVLRNSLFQGQYYGHQKKGRGTVLLGQSAERVVFFLQNHDQVANGACGRRLHQLTSPAVARALTSLFLLAPQTPHLFMGQEFFASTPFLYFVDHKPELMRLVQEGREGFLRQFPSVAHAMTHEGFHPPIDARALALSRLSAEEWQSATGDEGDGPHAAAWRLHRDLLRLRREDGLFARQDARRMAGAVLDDRALVLRWFGSAAREEGGDRLLVMNLGVERPLTPCPEPLLAPVPGTRWRLLFCSESTRYGGGGASASDGTGPWHLPGQCAQVFASESRTP